MTDIVERLRAYYIGNPGSNTQPHYPPICKEAANLITLLRSGNLHMCEELEKLRTERDAAAQDMRERCASEAFFTLASVVISDTGGTELGDHVAAAIRALPDTPAFVATTCATQSEGKS